MSNTSDNNNTSYISTIEHKPYSENTASNDIINLSNY